MPSMLFLLLHCVKETVGMSHTLADYQDTFCCYHVLWYWQVTFWMLTKMRESIHFEQEEGGGQL